MPQPKTGFLDVMRSDYAEKYGFRDPEIALVKAKPGLKSNSLANPAIINLPKGGWISKKYSRV